MQDLNRGGCSRHNTVQHKTYSSGRLAFCLFGSEIERRSSDEGRDRAPRYEARTPSKDQAGRALTSNEREASQRDSKGRFTSSYEITPLCQ
jgi:hypothetical protein